MAHHVDPGTDGAAAIRIMRSAMMRWTSAA
jgi:hypothetical protein